MQKGWLTRAGKFRVEHYPCPNPGASVDLAAPPKGILHTIEGSLESGLAVFRQHYAPTFTLGRDQRGKVRILQLVPLGTMGAALEHSGNVETNSVCRVQIEIAGFSKHTLWLPDAGTVMALGALMKTLESVAQIPLRHSPINRNVLGWEKLAGWFGHADVPQNTHWDAGRIDYKALFAVANDPPAPTGPPAWHQVKPKPRKLSRVTTAPLRLAARRAEPKCCRTELG